MAFNISVLLNITTKYRSAVVSTEDVNIISLFQTEVPVTWPSMFRPTIYLTAAATLCLVSSKGWCSQFIRSKGCRCEDYLFH